MKTTLDLNDELLRKAKILAAQQRTSLTRLIDLPVYQGKGGLVSGLDGRCNKALLVAADHDAWRQRAVGGRA